MNTPYKSTLQTSLSRLGLFGIAFLCLAASTIARAATISGDLKQWHPLNVDFAGPFANETDDGPNPFLDYRLIVEFSSPTGQNYSVPGFFAGNGNGDGTGNVWRAIFAADQPGTWNYRANFRQQSNLAVELDPNRGTPASFHGETGNFTVSGVDSSAPGFLRWGRLDYVADHYLKFRNGPYWIKTGTDSPENFLAYAGFDGTEDRGGVRSGFLHYYEPHRGDSRGDDPFFVSRDTGVDSRGIIGALNYLSDQAVNSIYFLPMNLGGDGYDTHPFLAPERNRYFKTHFDVSKLEQWNTVLNHAQRRGIALNVVLNETEIENREWQDNGEFGLERKLYYREMIARFGYLLAAKWNISEENNFSIDFVREAAAYIAALDWTSKPVSIHTPPDRFENYFGVLGNPDITATSIQYSLDRAGEYTETWRRQSRDSGVPWVIDMDENDQGLLDNNADDLRKRVLYDVLFSGGNIEWYFGFGGPVPGGDITVENFRTREAMWAYSRHARSFLENNTSFHRMQPDDPSVSGESGDFGGAEVFADPGNTYAIYLPRANRSAQLDTRGNGGSGPWEIRWYNPRNGQFESSETRNNSGRLDLGRAPNSADEDWVVLVRNTVGGDSSSNLPVSDIDNSSNTDNNGSQNNATGFVYSRTDKNEFRWVVGSDNVWIDEQLANCLGGATQTGDWQQLNNIAPGFDTIARPSCDSTTIPAPQTDSLSNPNGFVYSRTDKNEFRWVVGSGNIWIDANRAACLGGATQFGTWADLNQIAPGFDTIALPVCE